MMNSYFNKITKERDLLRFQGKFRFRVLWPDGTPSVDWQEFDNGIVTVGINHMLDVTFRNQPASPNWYFGLINETGFTELNSSDTMSSHPGWVELTTYTAAARPGWTPPAASGGSLTLTTPVSLTMSATSNIRGIFVTNNNTKGGTAGILWSTATTPSAFNVVSGGTYQFFYTLTLVP